MTDRLVQIVTSADWQETLEKTAKEFDPIASWNSQTGTGELNSYILVDGSKLQELVDKAQHVFRNEENFHLFVMPVEAYLPKPKPKEQTDEERKAEDKKKSQSTILREELENELDKGANCDRNYFLLVLFSTLVAAIGLLEDNVAVLVGAMVIAPFLGPNLALTFAAAMGDRTLAFKAFKTLALGSALAFVISLLVGQLWPFNGESQELKMRAVVDYSSIVLALASGAAAVLSLTKGIASVLVGVMVAVALLPPLTASGLYLGYGMVGQAFSAALLLAVNIVCVNLSGLLMFIFKGMGPRTWWEKRKARKSVYIYCAIWAGCLAVLIGIITVRGML